MPTSGELLWAVDISSVWMSVPPASGLVSLMPVARLAFATRPISQFRPGPGQVEQSSAEIWQQVCHAVKEAVSSSGVCIEDIRSLGFDATCSLVALDEQGRGLAVSPANRQTITSSCGWIIVRRRRRSVLTPRRIPLYAMLAVKVSVEMELPKVLWLKNHFPATAECASILRFGGLSGL